LYFAGSVRKRTAFSGNGVARDAPGAVDRARVRVARKRDAQMEPLSVSMDGRARGSPNVIEVLLLDELLERLAEFDARTAQVTEMRVFLG
jgi:hypothetical protein